MDIVLQDSIKQVITGFNLGILSAMVTNTIAPKSLITLISSECKNIENMLDLESIRELEAVKATRAAYRALGNDPNRYRPAADALLRRIVKGKGLFHVNTIVDILNLVSIKSGFSISGFDQDKIVGEISFGVGEAKEPYKGIGRGELNINKLPVLRDHMGAFGNPTSDSLRTMITLNTKQILFVIYDFGRSDRLAQALDQCSRYVSDYGLVEKVERVIIEF